MAHGCSTYVVVEGSPPEMELYSEPGPGRRLTHATYIDVISVVETRSGQQVNVLIGSYTEN